MLLDNIDYLQLMFFKKKNEKKIYGKLDPCRPHSPNLMEFSISFFLNLPLRSRLEVLVGVVDGVG